VRWRPSPATTVALAAAFALFGNMATNTIEIHAEWWPPTVWTIVGLLVLASVAIEVVHARSLEAIAEIDLHTVAGDLSLAVRSQWRREEEQRRVSDPVPLSVRWHSASERLVDDWSNILGHRSGTDANALDLAGRLDQIVEVYRRIPSGRLVILGVAGSGKTILASKLLLALLPRDRPEDPVPVIVSLGSWNPAIPLRDWLAAQLVRDHPGLAVKHSGKNNLAAALVEADLILPILDGFDEIRPELYRLALEQLNTVAGLPLVLTSRPDQYRAAVRDVDVLTAAACIEIDELAIADVVDYLPRTTRRRAAGAQYGLWQPILTYLAAPAGNVLRQVLTTPLMVYLIRVIYSDNSVNDPAELLDSERFPTPQALEQHLLAAFVPTVFRSAVAAGGRWKPQQADRWLTYLAGHLHRLGTQDLAWWQLRDSVPKPARLLAFGFAGGISGFAVFGLVVSLTAGLLGGLAVGGVGALAVGLSNSGPLPTRVHLEIRGRFPRVVILGSMGFAAGIVVGFAAAFVAGLAVGQVANPSLALPCAIAGGLSGALVGVVAFGFEAPMTLMDTVSVLESLAKDRTNTARRLIAFMIAGGSAIAVVFGFADRFGGGLQFALTAELIVGVVGGLIGGLVSAWLQWLVLVRTWLPLTGRLPWRTCAFLSDAYRLGVFRQVGATYQFRHARLQEQFISGSPRR
jgi:hypothetical protein